MIVCNLRSKVNEDICVMASPDNHGFNYLFDCGSASLLTVGDVMKLKALFVTHTHIDHFANFDFIIRNRAGSREPVIVCGPLGIADNVCGKFQSYTWNLIGKKKSWFEIREIVSADQVEVYRIYPPLWQKQKIMTLRGGELFQEDPIGVRYCILDHKIPSIAYRMSENRRVKIGDFPYRPGPWISRLKDAYSKNAPEEILEVDGETLKAGDLFHLLHLTDGYHVGYAMDHLGGGRNHELLREFFLNLDELFIESFFRQVDLGYALRHHHSTAFLSGTLAREANVKKLHLVHHSRRYLAEIPDLLEEGYAAYEGRSPQFCKTPVARFDPESEAESGL
jgi:ribonuclease Z